MVCLSDQPTDGKHTMTFTKWLDTFISEKNIDLETRFEVEGPSGTNSMPVASVIEQIKAFPVEIQATVKANIVKIDFMNGDVLHFLEYVAQKMGV